MLSIQSCSQLQLQLLLVLAGVEELLVTALQLSLQLLDLQGQQEEALDKQSLEPRASETV